MARRAQERERNAGFLRQQRALTVDGAPFVVDARDREAVRLFFNRIYRDPTPLLGWTGNHAAGVPGTTNPALKAATIQRVNWYRAMAGVPAAVRLSEEYSAKAQHAALIMSVAGRLSHYPSPDWKFYTLDGAEAASASNLALGSFGPEAIDQYIRDDGDNNAAVGHRRWILYPSTAVMGTGDVPSGRIDGKSLMPANALWVTDTGPWGQRPTVRDDFVAWPTRGFVPYVAVHERWSLSYPDADFSQAKVSVTRDGAPVKLQVEAVTPNVGENTIVWKMPDIAPTRSHAKPSSDIRYRVNVSNVLVAQRARSFDYDVIVIDPAVTTPGSTQAVASAPASASVGKPYPARIAALPEATDYILTEFQRKPLSGKGKLPIDAGTWTAANRGGHAIVDKAALRFYVDDEEWGLQTATLNKRLYVPASAGRIVVDRTMRLATSTQHFRIQASVDDGANWRDLYSEAGRSQTEPLTGLLRIALADYAGKIIQLRIATDTIDRAYIGPDTGWTVNGIELDGIEEVQAGPVHRSANGEFMLTPTRPGNFLLVPRAQLRRMVDTDAGIPAALSVDGAVLSGPRAAYTITRSNGLLTIVDNSGRDGTQTVRDPFRLDFTDVTLAFDVDGNAGQTYRLYRAAFNRTPDAGGLAYWIRSMDGGLTLENMARDFSRSNEFITLYGAAPTHSQVITAIYRNVLQRAPDEAGAAYWLEHLGNGMPIERLLVEFSESPENKKRVAAETALGIAYPRQ